MEITVAEALKLKNQISHDVSTLTGQLRFGVSYGVVKVDGREVVDTANAEEFPVALGRLEKLMEFNNRLQSALGEFNAEHGIPSLVRERQNRIAVSNALINAGRHCKAYSQVSSELVSGVGKVEVTRDYTPFMDYESEVLPRLQVHRQRIREIDNRISVLNAKLIELPFSYEELDEVASVG